MIRNLFYLFMFSLVYKIVLNATRYFQIRKYKDSYFLWLKGQNDSLTIHRTAIIKLFKNANIEDSFFPTAQPLGLGQIATFKVSVFANFPSRFEDQAIATMRSFDDAIGVYWSRIIESFSPIFWVNFIIFLPKNVLNYLGVKPESVIVKIFQLIWWLFGVLFGLFKNEFIQYVSGIIKAKAF